MTKHRIGLDARMFGSSMTGIGIYTEELLRHLLKIDSENEYTAFVLPQVYDDFPFFAPNLQKVKVTYPHYSYTEQLLYPTQLGKHKLDLIHYTNFNTPVFFRTLKSVVTVHDLTLLFFKGRKHSPIKGRAYRYAIKKACTNASRIIAVSQATKDDIVHYLGIDPDKIAVVYSGISARFKAPADPAKIEAVKSKYNISRPYYMYVGQWREHKNLVRLIRAFALLRRRYNVDHQLVIIGAVDPKAPEVMQSIKDLGLKDDVIVTGYIADEELPHFYYGAEAFVFPSLYEGFGIPPLEAMTAGTPVISSNASVMPEVLGDAALYFDPLDIEDIAAKLSQFAGSYRLKKELKEKGLVQVKKYSYLKTAKDTLAVYKKVLDSNSTKKTVLRPPV